MRGRMTVAGRVSSRKEGEIRSCGGMGQAESLRPLRMILVLALSGC
jgi:hypothetical protein